ncbi:MULTISPECIES: glycerophosphodiester phosphodiesterase [unclassified Arthrobacter]|uniref:glycerophosphodiester phosphodiesterase n=1 Tax=unclassified Arthrobacter TaxID=235627 RepID=UPI0015E44BB1|nr:MULTISPECIES: glycerophosphodiester phosphodiesterase [unclassified Arthrobacter]
MNSPRPGGIRARSAAGCVVIVLAALMAGCTNGAGTETTAEPAATDAPAAQPLTLIAHRSAWRVYPESSAEAMQALANTGYPIEFDLRPLADGTLVPSHDPLADRSLEGVTGPLEELSLEQWELAKVRSQDGETLGSTTTWPEILDEYTTGNVLFPELKRPVPDLEDFTASVISRQIQGSVIVQTYDYAAAVQLAASGLQALLLLLQEMPEPAEIKAQGIDYVGASRDLPTDYIRALKDTGLTVYIYTINSTERLLPYLELGIDGVYTDDPWKLERLIIEEGLFDE